MLLSGAQEEGTGWSSGEGYSGEAGGLGPGFASLSTRLPPRDGA